MKYRQICSAIIRRGERVGEKVAETDGGSKVDGGCDGIQVREGVRECGGEGALRVARRCQSRCRRVT